MQETKKRHTYGLIIFALVMLFNPNINLFDFLPDFIGYFILAKVFLRAADAAPYFEEARSSFVKLAYINLAKLLGLAVIGIVRSGNAGDYAIYALMALVFAALELIYLIPAIKNIFSALSYLGQRTSAKSLIQDGALTSTDALCSFTYFFAVFKCILYVLPEMLRLTGNVDDSSASIRSIYYPTALMISVAFGLIFGGVWLLRLIKYVNAVKKEGKFLDAIEEIAGKNSVHEFEEKVRIRSLKTTFSFFVFAAALSIDLKFDNFNEINLLPGFVFGALFFVGLLKICRHAKASMHLTAGVTAVSALYIGASVTAHLFSIKFFDNYGYSALLEYGNTAAIGAYRAYEAATLVEVILHIALAVLFFIVMRKYTSENLGYRSAEDSLISDDSYHKALNIKTAILSALCALCGIMHLINVYLCGKVKVIYPSESGLSHSTIVTSAVPWFSVLVTASVIIYAFFSVYYFNLIKEEINFGE